MSALVESQRLAQWRGLLAPSTVFVVTAIILVGTIRDYGITWDEAEINFPAARNQADWFRTFLSTGEGLSEPGVRRGFETESDHPSLPRTLMALPRVALPETVGDRVAFAAFTSLLVSGFTAFFFSVLWRRYALGPALMASAVLLLHPRWFAHAHFAEYDIHIAVAWFLAAHAFHKAMLRDPSPGDWKGSWGGHLLAAAVFGYALSVKLHAFFLPFPLVAWALVTRRWQVWKWVMASAVVAPLVYLLTQPYLWWHTVDRLVQRFSDYSAKVPMTVYYLGEQYPGNVPWHYPWVMLAATLPPGLAVPLVARALRPLLSSITPQERKDGWLGFVALNAVTVPLLFAWKSPYDGIRFFLPSLPFLAVLAAEGYSSLSRVFTERLGELGGRLWLGTVAGLLIVCQGYTCFRLHPHQLSYYSFLVGGVRGANALGLETTYWCDSLSPRFLRELIPLLPDNARVATHALDEHPLLEQQREGLLPPGWTFVKVPPAHARILQFRQGFFGPAEQALAEQGVPLAEVAIDGIPLVRVYRGP
ncbi:MAG: hypothetical protein GHCLOJNM_01883 [bacterium]|nr:hypothetical protein [bacterium]